MRFLVVLALSLLLAVPSRGQGIPANLPDFSRVGYRDGRVPERLPPTLNVADFGAKGDGKTDDTSAFRRALAKASAKGGVVHVPEGEWVLRGVLSIRSKGVVLQGAGSKKTTLVCPLALADLKGPSRSWSWGGGLIEIAPAPGPTSVVADVTGGKGKLLRVRWTQAKRPRPGEWLELRWFNDKGTDTLLDHLYGGVIPKERMGKELQASDAARVVEWVRVARVEEDQVVVERLVSLPLRGTWRPQLVRRPHVTEVGVEGLGFAFPKTEYPGHLKERGYNGVAITSAIDCWVRDVTTLNADSGVFVNRSRRVTVSDVVCRGRYMHHCLSASWSSHCLFTRWRIEAPHRHGTTISWAAHRNVFSRGWGRQLAMDSHRAAPFENLHSQITIDFAGETTNPFRSGGSYPRGPHTARGNVYWNVLCRRPGPATPVRIRGHREWPLGVFAGWRCDPPLAFQPVPGLKQRVLSLNRAPLVPDLHQEQVRILRLSESGF